MIVIFVKKKFMKFPILTCIIFLFLFSFTCPGVHAQDISDTSNNGEYVKHRARKLYFNSGFDAALLQMSEITRFDKSKLSVLRFSYFGNVGVNMHYDLGKRVGLFTGLGIKNIGFIEKIADSTIKRRVYALGVPLGIKLGNMDKRRFFIAGGGVDFPVNYKEKGFVHRNSKTKTREWFSDRVNPLMPYVFAGAALNRGLMIKLQFYPGNFMNASYSVSNGTTISYPFANYSANLMYLSIGINPNLKFKKKDEDKDVPKKVM